MVNYYQALQVSGGPYLGKWHYCVSSDEGGGTHAIGFCSPIKVCADCNPDGRLFSAALGGQGPECATCNNERWLTKSDEERCWHDTPKEARQCYNRYLVSRVEFHDGPEGASTVHRCQAKGGCSGYTSGYGVVAGNIFNRYHLCERHRTKEEFAKILNSEE